MAFDGITIANIVYDLNRTILNGRIAKIAQPEKDELILTIKGGNVGQARLLLSASASLPLIYLTDTNKPSPMNAPNFCMLLRKHIANGRITKIFQPEMERIGRAEVMEENRKFTVEIKSVNHRYFDVNIKMPKKLGFFESTIRNLLKEYMQRGKVDVFITYEDYNENNVALKYNEEIAREYLTHLNAMAEQFDLQNDITVGGNH